MLLVKEELGIVNLSQQQIQRTPYRELGISEGDKDITAYIPTETWMPLLGHSEEEMTCGEAPCIASEI